VISFRFVTLSIDAASKCDLSTAAAAAQKDLPFHQLGVVS
jgi:hypothetical protein